VPLGVWRCPNPETAHPTLLRAHAECSEAFILEQPPIYELLLGSREGIS